MSSNSPSLASQLGVLKLSAKDLLLVTKQINSDSTTLQQQSNKAGELYSPLSRAYLSGVRGSKAKPSGLGCVTRMTEAEIGGFASETKKTLGDKTVSLTDSSLRGTGGKIRAVKRQLLSSSSSAHLLAGLILDAIHGAKEKTNSTKTSSSAVSFSNHNQQYIPFGPSEEFKASYSGPLGSIREQLAAELHERGLDATYRVAIAKFLQRRLAQEREWISTISGGAEKTDNITRDDSLQKQRFIGTEKIATGMLSTEMQIALDKLIYERTLLGAATVADITRNGEQEGDDKIATFDENDELDDALLDDALDDLLG
jgi:hypothetical protein